MPAKNNMSIPKPSFTIVEKKASAVNRAIFGFTQFAGYELFVAIEGDFLCALSFCQKSQLGQAKQRFAERFHGVRLTRDDDVAKPISIALNDWYKRGRPPKIAIQLAGTPFQLQVWKALARIPFGMSSTYKKLASSIGRPNAARAVGNAAGANPVAIFIPCHRLLAAGGAIGGYAWGIDCKRRLLELEHLSLAPS